MYFQNMQFVLRMHLRVNLSLLGVKLIASDTVQSYLPRQLLEMQANAPFYCIDVLVKC